MGTHHNNVSQAPFQLPIEMSLKYLTLEVTSNSLKDVKRWYEDAIGMVVMRQSSNAVSLGFPNQGSSVWVELLASEKSGGRRGDNACEDVYWKIGRPRGRECGQREVDEEG